MTERGPSTGREPRVFPRPGAGFDPLTADHAELARHGLPPRPSPDAGAGLSQLWEQRARRYRGFTHLPVTGGSFDAPTSVATAARAGTLSPDVHCGYTLTTTAADPFLTLAASWTVPHAVLPTGFHGAVDFHTFVGLGDLDVHVLMRVTGQDLRAWVQLPNTPAVPNLTVVAGDVISVVLCLRTQPSYLETYLLANETTGQLMNLQYTAGGLPPALTIDAGVTRDQYQDPFPRFGAIYFDEIAAWTTSGNRYLTTGEAVTMVEDGAVVARPGRLADYGFKITPG
jgi:hypothetical protein